MEIAMEDFDSKKRERSPNFPFIGLAMAVTRARQFYDKERRGSAAVPVIAQHWGYSTKSSGLTQTIAALKSYGLMDEEGRGDARRLRLSERAIRILIDPRTESPERKEALRQAALSPSLCSRITDEFPDGLQSDANLEHFLLFDLKFSPESAKSVVKIFKENKQHTDSIESSSVSDNEKRIGDEMEVQAVGTSVASLQVPAPRLQATATQVAAMERIIGPNGEIILQWKDTPTWESYDFLEDYIKLRKKVLKQGASGGNQQDKDS
jgi:hypothetical protein